jgi:hypothetical protein
MRVIYTEQSFESLEESIKFLLKTQNVPLEKAECTGVYDFKPPTL